jgi:methyl-accepting chemotaxis protein
MSKLVELIQKLRLQLRWKLLGGFLAAIFLLLVALILALFSLFSTVGKLQTHTERVQQLGQIEVLQSQMVSSLLDYGWSQNLARANDYTITMKRLGQAIEIFQPRSLQQENYQQLRQGISSLESTLEQIVKLTTENGQQNALTLWRTQGSRQATQMLALTRDLRVQEDQQTALEIDQSKTAANDIAWLITWLGLITLGLAMGLAILLTSAVVQPLSQLQTRLANLAQGDLTQTVQIANRDELGDLAHTYNLTLQSLQELVGQLSVQSQQVNFATEELTLQARSQVAGSSQQSGAVHESTEALEKLNEAAEEIAQQVTGITQAIEQSLEQASSVENLADEMVTAHSQGRKTVERTIQSIGHLKAQMAEIEMYEQALAAQTANIEAVIQMIDNLAQETHLLALNASIEAAGSGVYGRRFAVIASEVKRLADHSSAATKQVRDSLLGIAQAVQQTNQSVAKGLQEAAQAEQETDQSDSVLLSLARLSEQIKSATNQIVTHIEGTARKATNIETITQQQKATSHQILSLMVSIQALTSQNLSSLKQGEQATQQLSLTAGNLKQSATAFKFLA